jgi:GNAT superfamily N-acetyltransferase
MLPGWSLTHLSDPLHPAFASAMDLYQRSFPVEEQEYASLFLQACRPGSRIRLLVSGDAEASRCFALYDLGERGDPVYLWYLATEEAVRGQGVGAAVYRRVLEEAAAAGAPALLFEVEDPQEALRRHGHAAETLAVRRIGWYLRLGAKRLEGVEFDCSTRWQGPVPMLPMVHALGEDVDAEQAYAWCLSVLADGDVSVLRQVGTISLTASMR